MTIPSATDSYVASSLLKAEFEKRGYKVLSFQKDGRPAFSFTSPEEKVWSIEPGVTYYPFTSSEATELFRHKDKANEFVAQKGGNVPFTRYIGPGESIDQADMANLFEQYPSLIVKPSNSLQSRGLTLDIHSPSDLQHAIKYAREVEDAVLIQEQVEGDEVRFMMIDHKVTAALLRQTPRIIGDGNSTVAQLIERENQARFLLKFPYITYPLLDNSMIDEALFTSQQVLPVGELKELNRATMIKNGASVYNILSTIDPSYVEMVERIAAELPSNFLSVDVFIRDYKTPLTDKNYWFIEFNSFPSLKFCYGCRDGKMYDVVPQLAGAIHIWLHRSDHSFESL